MDDISWRSGMSSEEYFRKNTLGPIFETLPVRCKNCLLNEGYKSDAEVKLALENEPKEKWLEIINFAKTSYQHLCDAYGFKPGKLKFPAASIFNISEVTDEQLISELLHRLKSKSTLISSIVETTN